MDNISDSTLYRIWYFMEHEVVFDYLMSRTAITDDLRTMYKVRVEVISKYLQNFFRRRLWVRLDMSTNNIMYVNGFTSSATVSIEKLLNTLKSHGKEVPCI